MISRHLLRIKAFQTIYSYRKNGCVDFDKFYKDLHFSINKSYELYLYVLQLLLEIKSHTEIRIEQIQARVIKDDNEWNKLLPLAQNKVIEQLENNSRLKILSKEHTISWVNNMQLVKDIYNKIITSELYAAYSSDEKSYAADKRFVKKIITHILLQHEDFFEFLEETSVYWNDDVDQVLSMVEKTINKFKEDSPQGGEISNTYNDNDAKRFVEDLFSQTLSGWNEFNPYIEKRLENWDQERVAEIDIILLQMAIAEAVAFKEIPTRVTMNEYIELSKLYSTNKSNIFINGILHIVFDTLIKEKKIVKTGRGLMS